MKDQIQFSKQRSIYWPGEFSDVMNSLTGRDTQGAQTGNPLYQFNTGAIVFAASIGLKHRRKREVGSDKKEITTTTFTGHQLQNYIFLIALLGMENASVDVLRVENEDNVIREFERYAAGGLEYLKTEFEQNPTQSADMILENIFRSALDQRAESIDLPDL